MYIVRYADDNMKSDPGCEELRAEREGLKAIVGDLQVDCNTLQRTATTNCNTLQLAATTHYTTRLNVRTSRPSWVICR